ncbi:hypothetical protein QJS04_geneDACA006154 [Acorus gramineus]|uniref:MAG2-interacting protein 2 n=1 Tax=Acorus gramineus TaxID=55184 RepID=A0AAV9B6P9_ACOGR|nr:hypothetical protein QJS04_geneDACA006154 [Acorus gramineus]
MEEAVRQVLYESRNHASGPLPHEQLKEKWEEYRQPRVSKKRASLFVSPTGEYVAVATGNRITILQKDDNYMEPCGIFTSKDKLTTFVCGAWSEARGILGVIDDKNTLHFIRTDGNEIKKATRSQLKISESIIGLFVQDDLNAKDGLFYNVEIIDDPSSCITCSPLRMNFLTGKEQFLQNASCLDFLPEVSCLVLVSSIVGGPKGTGDTPGLYSLSLWHRTGRSELELRFCSPHVEGLFSIPKGNLGPITTPRVTISPDGYHVAALDLCGNLNVFNVDGQQSALSLLTFDEQSYSQLGSTLAHGKRQGIINIVDVTWWSDHILMVARRSGIISMLDVSSDVKLLEDIPVSSIPILESVKLSRGHVFLLLDTLSEESLSVPSRHMESMNIHDTGKSYEKLSEQDDVNKHWRLMSFLERSVSEMYMVLIRNQQYQPALEFADRHGMDRDEIFKSQWLLSAQGAKEADMFLSNIKDHNFVLSECIEKVGPTEDAVRTLLTYGLHVTERYQFSELEKEETNIIWDLRIARLQLLQCKDRLETFVGINMGRFSVQGYSKFRVSPLSEAAIALAESGKLGALNLLFKRHPYTLAPSILDILSAIPETVPVQSYGQLLPGMIPPNTGFLRDGDWVECEKMVHYIKKFLKGCNSKMDVKTEIILKHLMGLVWPSVSDLAAWYKNRIRDIDSLSGQLDNCLSMADFACRGGITEMQQFRDDIFYLHQLIYSDGCDDEIHFNMSLTMWEQLSEYDKFKAILDEATEDTVMARLREKALPFMRNCLHARASACDAQMTEQQHFVDCERGDSFLSRWLKEITAENKLDICFKIIEDGCTDLGSDGIFQDEVESVDLTLDCIYLCTATDRWNAMSLLLSKLSEVILRGRFYTSDKDFSPRRGIRGFGSPRFFSRADPSGISDTQQSKVYSNKVASAMQNVEGHIDQMNNVSLENLDKRIKVVEGHVEVGRLLAYYQVPKPMSFFLGAHLEEKNEKAFSFLDTEYMLVEFCRGLLKAGKFSLARNYLKGTSTISLATEKVENLVIQAAREYFFSASSLSSTEIWNAKECLDLFPNSKSVKAEADIIDALTVKLPSLGVTLLPMQFKQIRNPMEIINMAITSQTGAYLDVDELIVIAKLLGLNSEDDIAAVQESVAREAAVTGDLQLAFDLCIVLSKKGHGSIWDLCAAIARGPKLDNMDMSSRKKLLGFALSHCDDDSINELLHAWKAIDMQFQCENLMKSTGTASSQFSVQGSSINSFPAHHFQDTNGQEHSYTLSGDEDREVQLQNIKKMLSTVAKDLSVDNQACWDILLKDNVKFLSFAGLQLPWLLELSQKAEFGKKEIPAANSPVKHQQVSTRMQAVVTIISWLANNDIAPSDDVMSSLAKSVMEPPVTEEEDVLGCSFLLNLMDAFHGVEVIEDQLRTRAAYQEICSIMNIGMIYSSLHHKSIEYSSPSERRELLLHKFQEKHASLVSEEMDQIGKAQSTFWKEWKTKLEEQIRSADQARSLEQIIPGVNTARFLSGDVDYIKTVVWSFIDSVKLEKKFILKEAVNLADAYGLLRNEVLMQFLGCALVSELWANDDILAEILDYKGNILACASGVINMIFTNVYPAVGGNNKHRLSFIYGILSDCFLQLKETQEPDLMIHSATNCGHTLELYQFYKILEQECKRVSYITDLNFKNIAGIGDLNFNCFNQEVYDHINSSTVEILAEMVRILVGIYKDADTGGLISWQDVYKHYILNSFTTLQNEIELVHNDINSEKLATILRKLELCYVSCRNYVRALSEVDILRVIYKCYMLSIPHTFSGSLLNEDGWLNCILLLLDLWIKFADDMQEFLGHGGHEDKSIRLNADSLSKSLRIFRKLIVENEVSVNHGWNTVCGYMKVNPNGGFKMGASSFCVAMIYSGCGFQATSEVFSAIDTQALTSLNFSNVNKDLSDLYVNTEEMLLSNLCAGSADHRHLHQLLSSLSKFGGNIDDLNVVRYAVWGRLAALSNDMQLPSLARMHVLELMQSITGRDVKGLFVELVSDIHPWERWDDLCGGVANNETSDQDGPKKQIMSDMVTSTLVALRSSQLAAGISPNIEINPEDLTTLESAVSCFLRLSRAVDSESQLVNLQGILEEWEGLFTEGMDKEKLGGADSPAEAKSWGDDEWDVGWDSFQEGVEKQEGKDDLVSIHPLHTCWMEIITKLVALSQLPAVIKLIDRSLSKCSVILLSEDEVHSLCKITMGIDCFTALKVMLLFPYKGIWFQCLAAVEAQLKHDGVPEKINDDHELLVLFVSSGVLSAVANDPSYSAVFSYFCYLVGRLSRACQEDFLQHNATNRMVSFGQVIIPCFVSELVNAGQYFLAGLIVSRMMCAHVSLSLINIAEACLIRYLEGQIRAQQGRGSDVKDMDVCGSLLNTVSGLRGRLDKLLQSALSSLSANVG